MDVYQQAKDLAVAALRALCIGDKKKATGPELLDWLKEHKPDDYPLIKPSWPSYLTRASKEPNGLILREPGSYGYLLRSVTPVTPPPVPIVGGATPEAPAESATPLPHQPPVQPTPTSTQPPSEDAQRAQREQKLYQIFADWLTSTGFQAEDTSTARSGGSWGNPDVVGIRTAQTIEGNALYEIATMEAKLTSNDWKRQFFEAVSHKRFADRVYFAFSYGADTPSVSDIEGYDELRAYAEKYRIGVVVVFFDVATHTKLVSGTRSEIDSLSLDEGRVEEIWPAVLDTSSQFLRDEFLRDVLEINDLKSLHAFGVKG